MSEFEDVTVTFDPHTVQDGDYMIVNGVRFEIVKIQDSITVTIRRIPWYRRLWRWFTNLWRRP